MKPQVRRMVSLFAGIVFSSFLIPAARAEVPIFFAGYTQLAPIAQGSYMQEWYRGSDPSSYQRFPDLSVGQVWIGDGHDHQDQYFDIYRAFIVFDVPKYKGVVTRDEIGIPDWAVPEVTLLRTKVTGATLGFQMIEEDPLGADLSPLEVNWSALPPSALIDGTIDPELAFNSIPYGPRAEAEFNQLSVGDGQWSTINLSDDFTNFLRNTNGGPIVFSFTMPLVDSEETLDMKYLMPEIDLNITYDGYAPFSPVPEPSTYACAGAMLCAALAISRSIKHRRSRLRNPV